MPRSVLLPLLSFFFILFSVQTTKGAYDTIKELRYSAGPFLHHPGSNSFSVRWTLPPNAGIQFFGDWALRFDNGTAIPTGQVYLHHITMSSPMGITSGCSDERSTFGPNFPLGSKYILRVTGETVDTTGALISVSYDPEPVNVTVTATLRYYAEKDIPPNAVDCICKAYAHSITVPAASLSLTENYEQNYPLPAFKGTMITAMPHGHFGAVGYKLIETINGTSTVFCDMPFFSHTEDPFIAAFEKSELPAQCAEGWDISKSAALKWGQTCVGPYTFKTDATYTFNAVYDAKCTWPGAHVQVYMWAHLE